MIEVDKSHILRELMKYKNFTSKADFARFLDITPQGLATWFSRNSFDVNKIASKFPEIDEAWLLTGKGDMLKESGNQKLLPEAEEPHLCPFSNSMTDVLNISKEVLEMNKKLLDQQADLIATIRALTENK